MITCNECGNDLEVYASIESVEKLSGYMDDNVFHITGSSLESQEYLEYSAYCDVCGEFRTPIVEW